MSKPDRHNTTDNDPNTNNKHTNSHNSINVCMYVAKHYRRSTV